MSSLGSTGSKAIVQRLLSIVDIDMRCAYAVSLLRSGTLHGVALEDIAERAELGEHDAKCALFTLVDALSRLAEAERDRLRALAQEEGYLALERLLREPLTFRASSRLGGSDAPPSSVRTPSEAHERKERNVPDYGKGRALTLGERKSLARKPDRAMFDKLLADPHPDVIERLLLNPRLTEDDVVRLCARRTSGAPVLRRVALTPRFVRSGRVRVALVCNPHCPEDIAGPLTALLLRSELELVRDSPGISPMVRLLCIEHLARRPPSSVVPHGTIV